MTKKILTDVDIAGTLSVGGLPFNGVATSYNPTITGFTQGNGTTEGSYIRIGDLVFFYAIFTFGSTSAGAADAIKFSPPFDIEDSKPWLVRGVVNDISTGNSVDCIGQVVGASGDNTLRLWRTLISASSVSWSAFGTSAPWAWAAPDLAQIYGFYTTNE